MEGYEWYDMLPKTEPWQCPRPEPGLSMCLQHHDYDGFIKELQYHIRISGKVDIENITLKCEGQCPNGCPKKFKLKLGKSVTQRLFEKMFLHVQKYPNHCITLKYNGVIKHGDVL